MSRQGLPGVPCLQVFAFQMNNCQVYGLVYSLTMPAFKASVCEEGAFRGPPRDGQRRKPGAVAGRGEPVAERSPGSSGRCGAAPGGVSLPASPSP